MDRSSSVDVQPQAPGRPPPGGPAESAPPSAAPAATPEPIWTTAAQPQADEVTLRLQRHEHISFRAWFYSFIILLAVLAAVRVVLGDTSRAAVLAGLFAYMSVACMFCPLPTTWLIVWAAAPAEGGGLGLPPLAVATGGAIATAIANMHDYYLLTFLYQFRPVRRIRATRLYRRLAAWYGRAPFATLAASSFLPIPVDFVRLLAISEGYHRAKFALGSLAGRWPRYLALAMLSHGFRLTWQWVLGIAGATVVLGLWRGLPVVVQAVAERIRARGAPSDS